MIVPVLIISTYADFHSIILLMIQSTKKIYCLSLKWSKEDIKMNTEKGSPYRQPWKKFRLLGKFVNGGINKNFVKYEVLFTSSSFLIFSSILETTPVRYSWECCVMMITGVKNTCICLLQMQYHSLIMNRNSNTKYHTISEQLELN